MRRVLVTSALPYANGPLHIGHVAGAYLPADVYTRYLRLRGADVVHICGTDEHGVAITLRAEERGVPPQELVDEMHERITSAFAALDIRFDNFSRTSRDVHRRTAQAFFTRLHETGDVYRKEVVQLHCPHCDRFLPDRYIVGECPHCGAVGARGDQCESCGRWLDPDELENPRCAVCECKPKPTAGAQYFLRLSAYSDRLSRWLEGATHWKPNVRNAALGWIREGLNDRAITRDMDWGVPVPLDAESGKVLYVWFEAPIGYVSSTKEWAEREGRDWRAYWCEEGTELVHFIGKDNVVFHAIVWPAMLMAHGGFNLPTNVPGNEFLNLAGAKQSTSRGSAVWAEEFVAAYGLDRARFGLANLMPETRDTEFKREEFVGNVNADLVDNYGNFVNRTLSFVRRFLGGSLPAVGVDEEVLAAVSEAHRETTEHLERFELRRALGRALALSKFANGYFDRRRPWRTRSTDARATETTLVSCAFAARALSVLMEPFVPSSSRAVREMMGAGNLGWDDVLDAPPATRVGEVSVLFEKLDADAAPAPKPAEGATISYDDFKRLDVVMARVTAAERVEGTERLLRLTLETDSGSAQVVAGLAERYAPEALVGKVVPFLRNLEPAVIRGVRSEGMILAANDAEGRPVLLLPDGEVAPGSVVK